MEAETHNLCETCGLADPQGKQERHLTPKHCIRALRVAMQRQRLAAESLGMDMSLHFLRALEELAAEPDAGFRYTTWEPNEGKQIEIPPQHVSGIFASILKRYREAANFSPHAREKEAAAHWARSAGLLAGMLLMFIDKYPIDEEDEAEARGLIEHTQTTPPEVAPSDPPGS